MALTAGPEVQWAELSRELCFPGGVDKPVAGGARTCSMGRQLLREPLTPVPDRRFWSLFALLKLGLALRQRHYIRITNVVFPRKLSFFPHTLVMLRSFVSETRKEPWVLSKAIRWC